MPTEIEISRIKVANRVRKHLDGIAGLAESIKEVGLLHPVVINKRRELIAGGRRLEAVKSLGWLTVPIRVIDTLNDALLALKAEHDENTHRMALKPSEMVEMGRRLEELEKPKAEERKGQRTDLEPSGNFPPSSDGGKTRDIVGEALGVSGKTYEAAKTIAEHGSEALKEAVDAGEVSISAGAEVAKLPEDKQEEIVAKGPEAVKKAAKASRQAKAKDKPEPVNQPAAAESASDTPVHTPPDRLTMLCPTCCGTGRVPKKQPVQPLYTATGMPEIPAALDTPDFILAWESWLHERKRRKQTVTPNAARLQLRDLDAHGVKVAIETIETSIKNGWTGLFPGKAGTNGQHAHGRNGRVQAGVRVVGAPGDFDDCAPALS